MNTKRNYLVRSARIIGQFGWLFAFFSAQAANLEVQVENRLEEGTIYAALYAGEKASWRNKPVALAMSDSDRLQFADLPPGQYALQIFQDTNGNRQLDMGKLGTPHEPVGVSGNPKPTRGRPAINECLFTVEETGSAISIQLRQPPAAKRK